MNATDLRTSRALLLDAIADSFDGLSAALCAHGFDVPGAGDGDAGLALLLDHLLDLDVLVVDADLPGRDAEGFLRLVREAGGERELGIVVVSSGLDGERRRALLALGADAVVDRRLGPASIAATASRAAQRARERRSDPAEVAPALVTLAGWALAPVAA